MIQPEGPQKKKSLLDRLPKLGRVSQLMLLVGIFLILLIPLLVIYQQQPAKQVELEHELSLLETVLAAPAMKKEALAAEIRQAEAELEAAKEDFPSPDRGPEIIDSLIELAELNDIYVTSAGVTTSQKTITVGEGAKEFTVLTFDIGLSGQVPKFQTFILALDERFPTCQVKGVEITLTEEEGEEDMATLEL
ncbi:MAG TPA: hypothetical protein G4O12_02105, partial [Dehalococcoidia bacterium]|nr:hypothetical protein [Dehalococcoidia bacterium]